MVHTNKRCTVFYIKTERLQKCLDTIIQQSQHDWSFTRVKIREGFTTATTTTTKEGGDINLYGYIHLITWEDAHHLTLLSNQIMISLVKVTFSYTVRVFVWINCIAFPTAIEISPLVVLSSFGARFLIIFSQTNRWSSVQYFTRTRYVSWRRQPNLYNFL